MPLAPANGIDLWYDTFGDPDGPALLLVTGLGGQAVAWDDAFCEAFADRGFFVIRFDNRDAGLSTWIPTPGVDVMGMVFATFAGREVQAPYLLSDMADDAAGLLAYLGVEAAHVVGVSMGGMIAQTLAIEHPGLVLSLTSIMSSTGDRDVGQPAPEAVRVFLRSPAADRADAVEAAVEAWRVLAGPVFFDEERTRDRAGRFYDRAFNPEGIQRQLLAIFASGSRTEHLHRLDLPTLVVHGDIDLLVAPSGGVRTAEAIPGAELDMIEDMGHELPPILWSRIVEAVTRLAAGAMTP
ncbi:MAG: alpha/beta fold hydrolase [Acidimicrobiia bacterium]